LLHLSDQSNEGEEMNTHTITLTEAERAALYHLVYERLDQRHVGLDEARILSRVHDKLAVNAKQVSS